MYPAAKLSQKPLGAHGGNPFPRLSQSSATAQLSQNEIASAQEIVQPVLAKLTPLDRVTSIEEDGEDVEVKTSASRGIYTKYVRSYYKAWVHPDVESIQMWVHPSISMCQATPWTPSRNEDRRYEIVRLSEPFLLTDCTKLYAWLAQEDANYLAQHPIEEPSEAAELLAGMGLRNASLLASRSDDDMSAIEAADYFL